MAMRIVNPFYPLLMVAGVVFSVTAFAFWLSAVRQTNDGSSRLRASSGPSAASADGMDDARAAHPLDQLMRHHGMTLILVELVVLAIATFAAIGTDQYWESRSLRKPSDQPDRRPDLGA